MSAPDEPHDEASDIGGNTFTRDVTSPPTTRRRRARPMTGEGEMVELHGQAERLWHAATTKAIVDWIMDGDSEPGDLPPEVVGLAAFWTL